MTDLYRYHLTIHRPDRRQEIDPDVFDYISYILLSRWHIMLTSVQIESGKYGGNHIHCIAFAPKQIKYKQFSKMYGYRLYWKPYHPNVKEYITKQTKHEKEFGSEAFFPGGGGRGASSPPTGGTTPSDARFEVEDPLDFNI